MITEVDRLYNEYEEISNFLSSKNEISLSSNLNKQYKKVILLSSASYYEHQIISILSNFVAQCSQNDTRLINFLKIQAISGKYHQLFNWGEQDNPDKPNKNANRFWRLFGNEFKERINKELETKNITDQVEIKKKEEVITSIQAFLEIGHLRNILVHNNFAAYDYNQKTTQEIYLLHQGANRFIEYVQLQLKVEKKEIKSVEIQNTQPAEKISSKKSKKNCHSKKKKKKRRKK